MYVLTTHFFALLETVIEVPYELEPPQTDMDDCELLCPIGIPVQSSHPINCLLQQLFHPKCTHHTRLAGQFIYLTQQLQAAPEFR